MNEMYKLLAARIKENRNHNFRILFSNSQLGMSAVAIRIAEEMNLKFKDYKSKEEH